MVLILMFCLSVFFVFVDILPAGDGNCDYGVRFSAFDAIDVGGKIYR